MGGTNAIVVGFKVGRKGDQKTPSYIHKVMNIRYISEAHMSPTLSGKSVLQHVKLCDELNKCVIGLRSYPGLPCIHSYVQVSVAAIPCTCLRPLGGT